MTHSLKNRIQGEFIALYVTIGIRRPPATILLQSHVLDNEPRHNRRIDLCRRIAEDYKTTFKVYAPNELSRVIRIDSKELSHLLDFYVVDGHVHEKRFDSYVFDLDDESLLWIADGLLNEAAKGDNVPGGDSFHVDFCRDEAIVPDLHRMCERMGYTLALEEKVTHPWGSRYESFQGELKKT